MPADPPGAAPPSGPPAAVTAAVERLLAPLVRVLIHFGVTFPMLGTLLKRAYVETAIRHFALAGRGISDSRVALLTGLHRKDISLLRHRPEQAPARPATLLAQVVSRWMGHPDWQDGAGRPLALPRAAEAGPSFEALVAGISRDIRPRTLLDELLRAGLVRETGDDRLELLGAADVPGGDIDRLAYYFGRNLADHLDAAGQNLTGQAPPHLERALAFDGLSPAAIATLEREAGELAMAMLLRLNARAVALAEADPPAPADIRRFTAGVYVFSAPDAPAGSAPAAPTEPGR